MPKKDPPLTTGRKKICGKCKVEKLDTDFHLATAQKDGLMSWCKLCWKAYMALRKQSKSARKKFRLAAAGTGENILPLEEQSQLVKNIVRCFLENPRIKIREVAQIVHLKPDVVSYYCTQNTYIQALRTLAARKVSDLIPLAVKGIEDSLTSESSEVKFKASSKILENEGIIGPTKIDIGVTDLRSQSMDKINEIISNGKDLPNPTIVDAELVQ